MNVQCWPGLLLSVPGFLVAQNSLPAVHTFTIPAGTPLEARLMQNEPMRAGANLRATLVYPLYVDNRLALPAGTELTGTVVDLEPDKSRRADARLNADFTPFHHPMVRFDHAVLAGGMSVALDTSEARNGAPLLHLSPAFRKSRSMIKQQWYGLKQQAENVKEAIIAPGKGDRLLQLLYSQLPYHPERIEKGTVWSFTLTAPAVLPVAAKPARNDKAAVNDPTPADSMRGAPRERSGSLLLHAYLDEKLSSQDAKTGSTFRATIAEPVRGPDNALLVPEGSRLVGTITRARPARSFGRAGVLRFSFRQLDLPQEEGKQVIGSLAGADSATGTKLALDSEGEVKPQQQSKVLVPLAMTFLASRPLDDEGNLTAGAAVGSNGLGLLGRILGMTTGSRDLAAGIGFYGGAISVYRRWIRRGHEVEFPKYNRIDVAISQQAGRELLPP
jgi:hypothetical protein